MNRIITRLFAAFLVSMVWSEGKAQWCNTGLYTTFGCTDNDYVQSFSTTGASTNITNNNTACNGGVSGYNFFSGMTCTAMQNTSVNWALTNTPSWSEGYKIWIDWNQDGVFTATANPLTNEEVYASAATILAGGTANGSFTVPISALPGLTRMRVRCVFATTTFGPCTSHTYGEVEDYNFMVVAATPCAGQPVAGTAVAVGSCPSVLNLNGVTLAGQIAIQWQKKAGCDTSWSNIPGATNYNYPVVSLTASTQFRAIVTCMNSGLSDISSIVTMAAIAPCYLAPAGPTSTFYNDITSVTVGPLVNTSNCNTTGGAGSILNRYSNYAGVVPTVNLTKGTSYPVSIITQDCNGFTQDYGTAIFVDWNMSGTFETGERIYGNAAMAPGAQTVTGTTTPLPPTAGTGVTGMRIIHGSGSTGLALTPTTSFNYGEVEDYMVNILYAPTATGEGVYCSGASVVLHGSAPGMSGNYSYLWKTPSGPFIPTQDINFNSIQVSDAGIYKLYVLTYPCGGTGTPDTSGAREVNVAVNQTPPMPIVPPVLVYCQGDIFDTIPVFGQNLKWYSVPVGGIGSTIEPVVNTSVFGSVTYYVSQTIVGCESPRAPVTINVVAKPNPPLVKSPVVYCQADVAVPLQAVGQNLLWYSVATGGVGTPITPTPTTNAQGVYTWYVSQTIAGCESARRPVEVRVSYVPNAMITIDRPYVCQYDEIDLNYFGNATPDADYLWGLPTGATLVSGSGQGPLTVRFDSAGVRRIHLQVDNGGCKGPATYLDLTVRAVPVLSLDMQPDACVGEVVNLAIGYISASVDKYAWDFMGGETVYGAIPTGPYGLRWSTSGIKTVTIVATDDDCSSLPVTDVINVHALPDATISAENGVNICAGDSLWLSALYDADHSYRWQPEQYFGNNNTHREVARVDKKGFVYLTVSNEFNCIGHDSLLINAEPCCQVYFPNAFTPNSDGVNDVFRMIRKGGSHDISTFRVVNRWGHTVFETADDHTGWDGTFNGKPQDMGTYQYYIRYKCADGNFYEDKGDFLLMR